MIRRTLVRAFPVFEVHIYRDVHELVWYYRQFVEYSRVFAVSYYSRRLRSSPDIHNVLVPDYYLQFSGIVGSTTTLSPVD